MKNTEIMTADSGDLIWWRWNRSIGITINLIEATLLMDKKLDPYKCKSSPSKFKKIEYKTSKIYIFYLKQKLAIN